MSREERLRAIIDELQYEHRKVEYGSALERLTRRVDKLEQQMQVIINYVKYVKKK